jgi:hypothetical protein
MEGSKKSMKHFKVGGYKLQKFGNLCIKLSQLKTESDAHLYSFSHCLEIVICNLLKQSCFFSNCKNCPAQTKEGQILENVFEKITQELLLANSG